MKSQDIRNSFLEYFRGKDHQVHPSAPLVPRGDPTLLFTNAGMVPFKNYFLGLETPEHRRAVSVQKCLRVSGKHNDLENVGPSPRHHTFFEMLGNFSFGDYFKDDAIRFGWELVTEVWGLSAGRLAVTVFEEDDEAAKIWADVSGLPAARIHRCGAKDNFWAMGDTGPCGPCSEIFVDTRPDLPDEDFSSGSESGRYLEIWNLVFMQFDRDAKGEMTPLPRPSIDTGAGLERVAAVLQNVDSNYDTDLFQPILRGAAELAGTAYGKDPGADVSLRVVADHLRAVGFLLADGVIPSNDGRGYVLRRILRRGVRHGMNLGFEEPFLCRLLPILTETMGAQYEELAATQTASVATVRAEEEKFLETLASGAKQVQEAIERARVEKLTALPGEEVFRLYDTHGLPLEVISEIAEEERLGVDRVGFERELKRQRERSRAAGEAKQGRSQALIEALRKAGAMQPTTFEGYDQLESEDGRVVRIARWEEAGAEPVERLAAGERGMVVLEPTVFYAEGGGQVGDVGSIEWDGGSAHVVDTQKDSSGVYFAQVEVESGHLEAGQSVVQRVDRALRRATERHHTATHLLHAALRDTLGESVRQAGSLVAPDRLRFDFTFGRSLEAAEIREIEDQVNAWVLRAVPSEIQWRSREEALASGAMALFGEKYGDRVRTVEVPGFSLELCGGCHVRNTGEIGAFLVLSERGVASGVRRIEAIAGGQAIDWIRGREAILDQAEGLTGAPPERIPEEIEGLQGKLRAAQQELSELRVRLVSGSVSQGDESMEIDGVRLVAKEVPPAPMGDLRNLADTLRSKLGSGVAVLLTREEDKVHLVVAVSPDLSERVHAGKLAGDIAERVGGRGGGRADFAQAGGREPEKVEEALQAVPDLLRQQLEG